MESNAIHILIVEDLTLTRMGIRTALNNSQLNCQIVAEAGTLREAKQQLAQNPDIQLVLLDLLLPDGNGAELVPLIKAGIPDCKILVISAETEKSNIIRLIDQGIQGFISKFSDEHTLEAAIHSVCDGIEFFGQDITEIIHAVSISKDPDLGNFTSRELEIMRLCAKGHNVKRIAEELCISTRTVETHKNNIFKKLGFNSTVELVNYVFENGIVRN